MGPEAYFVLGVAAVLLLLVAGMRSVALGRYRDLLDSGAPRSLAGGSVRGIHAGRGAQIGLLPSGRGTYQYSKVQISIETSVPLRIEAYPESMAIAARKAFGVVEDRSLGIEDLDRRFALQFDDRPRTRSLFARIEARDSLLALADLGADFILLTNGILTVEIPARFVLLPRRERVRDAMTAMNTLVSSAESALSIPSPQTSRGAGVDPSALDSWPAARPSGSVITAPAVLATFFIAMILALWIVGSFWDFNGRVPWQTRLLAVSARLPQLALLAGAAALLVALIVPRRPLLLAFLVSWPLVIHAALVGVVYLVIRASGIPEVRQALGNELEMIPAGLKIAAAAAGVGLGSGLAGAILGKRLSRIWMGQPDPAEG